MPQVFSAKTTMLSTSGWSVIKRTMFCCNTCTSASTWRGARKTGTDGRTVKINSLPACWKQNGGTYRDMAISWACCGVRWNTKYDSWNRLLLFGTGTKHNDFVDKCKRESLKKEQVVNTNKHTGGGTSAEMVHIQKHKNTSVSPHLDSIRSWKWVKCTKTPFNIWSPIKFVSMHVFQDLTENNVMVFAEAEMHGGVSVELTT